MAPQSNVALSEIADSMGDQSTGPIAKSMAIPASVLYMARVRPQFLKKYSPMRESAKSASIEINKGTENQAWLNSHVGGSASNAIRRFEE